MLDVLLHVAAGIAFAVVLIAALGLIAGQLHGQRFMIVAALFGEARPATRTWPVRVRTVSRPAPGPARVARQSCAIA